MNEIRLNCNGELFSIGKTTYLRFTINSPGVFGDRNFSQGFMNWVEFSVGNETKKFEYKIQNQVMEDNIIELIGKIKSMYNIPISVEIIKSKKRESWFESWFGNG